MYSKYFSTETQEGEQVIQDIYELITLTEKLSELLCDNWTQIVRDVSGNRGKDCAFARKACLLLAIEDIPKYKDTIDRLNTIVNRIPRKEEFYNVEERTS